MTIIKKQCLATISNCGQLFRPLGNRQHSVADGGPAHPKDIYIYIISVYHTDDYNTPYGFFVWYFIPRLHILYVNRKFLIISMQNRQLKKVKTRSMNPVNLKHCS